MLVAELDRGDDPGIIEDITLILANLSAYFKSACDTMIRLNVPRIASGYLRMSEEATVEHLLLVLYNLINANDSVATDLINSKVLESIRTRALTAWAMPKTHELIIELIYNITCTRPLNFGEHIHDLLRIFRASASETKKAKRVYLEVLE
jgi:hypothetical protein